MKRVLQIKDLAAVAAPLLLGPLLLALLAPRLPDGADLSLPLLLWLLLIPLAGGGVAGWRHPRRATMAGLHSGLLICLILLFLLVSLLPRLLPAMLLPAGGALPLALLAAYAGAGLKQAKDILAQERKQD